MSTKDVTIVDISPPLLGDNLADGNVDAVVAWQPYADQIKKRLENNTISSEVQSGQAMFWSIACSDAFAALHPQLVKRFLASLLQAEDYIDHFPNESKIIVQKMLHYDESYLTDAWPENQFSLSLDQSLISAMEDEARWMIENNLTTNKQVPDFIKYIYDDALEQVKPEAVTIIK
jgi:NitT/TauT family transport system substrate-binding protein